jgi:hypothetical protein
LVVKVATAPLKALPSTLETPDAVRLTAPFACVAMPKVPIRATKIGRCSGERARFIGNLRLHGCAPLTGAKHTLSAAAFENPMQCAYFY